MGRKHAKSHYFVKNDFQTPDFLIRLSKGCLVQRSQYRKNFFIITFDALLNICLSIDVLVFPVKNFARAAYLGIQSQPDQEVGPDSRKNKRFSLHR